MYKTILFFLLAQIVLSCKHTPTASLSGDDQLPAFLTQEQCNGIMNRYGLPVQAITERNFCPCEDGNTPFRNELSYLGCLRAYDLVTITLPEDFSYQKPASEDESEFALSVATITPGKNAKSLSVPAN